MTKPFQIEELLARIRATLRSHRARQSEKTEEETDEMAFADLRVNVKTREVERGTQQIELTPTEFDLLVDLMKHKNQVLNATKSSERVGLRLLRRHPRRR